MNIHNKLKNIGFRKIGFYRRDYDPTNGWLMVPDLYLVSSFGTDTKVHKKHPKSNSLYVMNFTREIKLWAFIKEHELFEVLIEDKKKDIKSNDRIKSIWNRSSKSFINSSRDILNILPKDVRRDILLNQILNKN